MAAEVNSPVHQPTSIPPQYDHVYPPSSIARHPNVAVPAPIDSTAETPLGRSIAAYRSQLSELLKTHHGDLVAYVDGERVGWFAKSQLELYQYCLKDLALTHDRFIVRLVFPGGAYDLECEPR